jgi:DNA polymerase-3 subunit delta'
MISPPIEPNMTAFSHIFGQQRAVSLLTRACASGRLPHGLLFAGPAGVGKATTAMALAKLILCQSPQPKKPGRPGPEEHQSAPCNNCQSCRLMDRSTQSASAHPDFHLITKELIRFHDKTGKSKGIDLSIQVIRHELIDPAGRKAVLGRAKVFVIHEADLMTAEAQNALLKTLEEPLGTTAIILLTDLPQALLPTVRSRCQLVTFVPLPTELIERELLARNIDKKEARAAAALAEGSLGQALQFVEGGIVQKAQELFSIIDTGQPIHDWLKSAAADYAAAGLARDELASKDQLTRQGLSLYLRLASQHLRQKLRDLTRATDENALEETCGAIDSLVRAEQLIDANVNIPLALQNLTIDLRYSAQHAAPRDIARAAK